LGRGDGGGYVEGEGSAVGLDHEDSGDFYYAVEEEGFELSCVDGGDDFLVGGLSGVAAACEDVWRGNDGCCAVGTDARYRGGVEFLTFDSDVRGAAAAEEAI